MTLAKRLDKLEPAMVARWREDWERLAQRMRDHTPPAVDARLEQAYSEHRAELDARLDAPPKPSGDAAEMLGILRDVNLHGLDLYALEAWFNATDFPDLDRPNLSFTLAALPMPPDEPSGVWEALEPFLADPGIQGHVAAIVLFVLATARAVREARQ